MVTFPINVTINPSHAVRGAARVNTALGGIQNRANLLRQTLARTFQFLGIAVGIRGVLQLADAYTNLQNRIRVLTRDEDERAAVSERLFRIANDTRQSVESTAQIYQRLAVAGREAGKSQHELLNITETLNKAVVISGATAGEAEGALIQLSQGFAINQLRGQELRSVLEQLPIVADLIAKEMGVTRGELLKLGAQGKITGDVMFDALSKARKEIDERFKNTVSTFGQAFAVLRNQIILYIGEMDKATGVLGVFVSGIRFVADNLRDVVGVLTSLIAIPVAAYLIRISKTFALLVKDNPFLLAAAGAAFLASKILELRNEIDQIYDDIDNRADFTAFGRLGDDIRRAEQAFTAAFVNNKPDKEIDALRKKVVELREAYQGMIDAGKRDASIVETKALDEFNASLQDQIDLLRLSTRERGIQAEINAKIAALEKAGVTITRDVAIDVSNQVHLIQLLKEQADVLERIEGPQRKFNTLSDVAQRLFDEERISADQLTQIIAELRKEMEKAEKLDPTVGFRDLLKELGAERELLMLSNREREVRTELLRREQEHLDKFKVALSPDQSQAVESQIRLNQALSNARQIIDNSRTPIEEYVQNWMDGVAAFNAGAISLSELTRLIAEISKAELRTPLQQYLTSLEEETRFLSLNSREREVQNTLLQLENDLRREGKELTGPERENVAARLRENQALADQAQIMDALRAPSEHLAQTQAALNALYDQGSISLGTYNAHILEAALAAARAGTTIGEGFAAGLLAAQIQLEDVSGLTEQTVTGAIGGIEDAFVSLATTGSANISALVDSVLADVARLVARQGLGLLFSLLGGAGGPGAGVGGLFGIFQGIFGRAAGGPVVPGRDYIVGEEGPERFRATAPGHIIPSGGEGNRSVTTAQQAPIVNVAPPQVHVTVVNVSDPKAAVDAMDSPEGDQVIYNRISRKKDTFRNLLA
jgi:tape measure domain-containing protein